MEKKQVWFLAMALLAGFAGGVLSHYLTDFFQPSVANAASQEVLQAKEFQLVNGEGRITGRWTNCDGAPCFNLYDPEGRVRLQVGLYNDGLPLVGLFNNRFEAKALLRLFGNEDAPVLIFKNNNQDRLIVGLNLSTGDDPFIVYFDQAGQKHLQFGDY